MNNSHIALELPQEPDIQPKLREEEARILRIVEAIRDVRETAAWSTLKSEVLDRLTSSLEKELRLEAKKEDPDPKKLNRLSGELKWAERYSDLSKLEESYRLQLTAIRTNKGYGTSD